MLLKFHLQNTRDAHQKQSKQSLSPHFTRETFFFQYQDHNLDDQSVLSPVSPDWDGKTLQYRINSTWVSVSSSTKMPCGYAFLFNKKNKNKINSQMTSFPGSTSQNVFIPVTKKKQWRYITLSPALLYSQEGRGSWDCTNTLDGTSQSEIIAVSVAF